ncbi:hypothetical protein MLD38_004258 [Melastoma candidum]|uniref:Uncharacterized protein n=1 Tax=Melastoma candidum TaxID=119954 RepID=A0ACB9SDQ4_9MYRT|nr:hypothetical protein MLD38_004258 [Melastoma candidum]
MLDRCTNLKHLYQTHAQILVRGIIGHDDVLLSSFLVRCFSLGSPDYGLAVFTRESNPSVYLCNTMIKSLSDHGCPEEALFLYNRIRGVGQSPDSYSVPFALAAVMRIPAADVGEQIHCQSIGIGLSSDVHVATALVKMYGSLGCVGRAREVFDELSGSGYAALWNAMVTGYAKAGDVSMMRDLFERMPERDVISWTAVVTGYAQLGRPSEAIKVFRRMLGEGIEPDQVVMLAAMSACSQLGAATLGNWICCFVNRHRLKKSISFQNAVIDMYAKTGNIAKATEVFDTMKSRSVVSWTTMISGLAFHAKGGEALKVFSRMQREKIQPNKITFIAVLSACSHSGLYELGRGFLNAMRSKYGIEPEIEHYGCIVDLLGRGGYLQEAQGVVKSMPLEANAAIWGSLLHAASIYDDLKLGKKTLHHLTKLEPWNSGNYAILSNVLAHSGRWDDSGRLRKVMKEAGIYKIPGRSSIELNDEVHEFSADDQSHSSADSIYKVLGIMDWDSRIDRWERGAAV